MSEMVREGGQATLMEICHESSFRLLKFMT